jgi:polar amino acid transport system substrate-binding protein
MIGLLVALLLGPPETPTPILRVGLDPRDPPWAFVPGQDYSRVDLHRAPSVTPDQLSHLEGLDVDVLAALAQRMGVRTNVVPTSWFDVEAGLLAKRFDLIVSSWTPSLETPSSIRATSRYWEWGLLIVVRADEERIRSYQDLQGLKVGIFPDPAAGLGTAAMGRGLGLHFVRKDGGDQLLGALRKREVDAIVYDSAYLKWRLQSTPEFRVVGDPLNRLGYNIGVRSEDEELFDRVEKALKDLVASPEMAAIRKRWETNPGSR